MNPDFRKVALIAASLGFLVSLFFALRPDGDDEAAPAPGTSATTAATTSPATTAPAPAPRPDLELELRGGKPVDGVQRATVDRGPISITVESDTAEQLHLHGYDLLFPIEPGSQEIQFAADAPGVFELELEGSHTPVAELEVRP